MSPGGLDMLTKHCTWYEQGNSFTLNQQARAICCLQLGLSS
jgi:hypothetical protein